MWLRFSPKQPQKLAVIRQYLVAVSASLPYAAAGTAIAWPSPTLPRIMKGEAPLFLNVSEVSWMIAFLYLGSFVSAIPSGYLADRFGRRTTLLYFGFLPVISWGLILINVHTCCLFVARFLAGLQMGVSATLQPIYIAEVSQPDVRETLNSLSVITMNAGSLFILVIGPFVSYYTLAWVSISLPIIFLLTFRFAPESPYYIMMKGNIDDARETLLWLRGDLNRIELEFELDQIERVVESLSQNRASIKEIFFSETTRKAMITSLVYSAGKELSGAGVVLEYATVTLPGKTFGVLTPNECLIIIGTVTLISSFFASWLSASFGCKKVRIASYFVCSFSMIMISVWYFLNQETDKVYLPKTCFVPFLGYLIHALAFSISCCHLEGNVKTALFPVHLKTKSSVLSTVVSSATAFVLNKFYLIIANWEGMYLNYALYSVSCVLIVFFTVFCAPETSTNMQDVPDVISDSEQIKVETPVLAPTF